MHAILYLPIPRAARVAAFLLLQSLLPVLGMYKSDHSCVESDKGAQVKVVSKCLHVGKHLAAACHHNEEQGHKAMMEVL